MKGRFETGGVSHSGGSGYEKIPTTMVLTSDPIENIFRSATHVRRVKKGGDAGGEKKLGLLAVALFSVAVAGTASADMIMGEVKKVENDGRAVTVKSKDGKKLTLRASGNGTALKRVGNRGEIKEGMRADADFDRGDRNTEKNIEGQQIRRPRTFYRGAFE